MAEQRKSFQAYVLSRLLAIGLTILPYGLVTACGAAAVAAVTKTSTRAINMKFNTVIQALKRR